MFHSTSSRGHVRRFHTNASVNSVSFTRSEGQGKVRRGTGEREGEREREGKMMYKLPHIHVTTVERYMYIVT